MDSIERNILNFIYNFIIILFWLIGFVFSILYYKKRIKHGRNIWLVIVLFASLVFINKIIVLFINEVYKNITARAWFEIIKACLLIIIPFILVLKAGIYIDSREHFVDSLLLYNNKPAKSGLLRIIIITAVNLLWFLIIIKIFRINNFIKLPTNNLIIHANHYLYIGLIGPLNEEIFYRFTLIPLMLTMFNKFKYKAAASILVSTIVFVLSHFYTFDNYIIARSLQLAPFGISLGYLSLKKNIEESVAVHALYNIFGTILVSYI